MTPPPRPRRFAQASCSAAPALAFAALAIWLALNHPLSSPLALSGVVLVVAICCVWPQYWPLLVFGALPVAGLMTWSGWLVVEEFDLLVLAAAAGVLMRDAITPSRPRQPLHLGLLAGLLVGMLYAGATLISGWRGVQDAGGWAWGWWQGYHEPLNSLRVGKSLLLAGLTLPVALALWRRDRQRFDAGLVQGLALTQLVAALMVVWERQANTGLANFSTDYRSTGLFWEMHVGGAALDAVLAAAMPFAVLAMFTARSRLGWALAAAALVLGAYASLATFSRIVYVALPLGCALLVVLRRRQAASGAGPGLAASAGLWSALGIGAVFVLAAWWVFPSAGYRGLLALWGAVALALPLAHALRGKGRVVWLRGLAGGAVLAGLAFAAMQWLPKGAYCAYAAAALGTAAALWRWRAQPAGPGSGIAAAAALAGGVAVVMAFVLVSGFWGGESAWHAAWPVALGLLAVLALSSGSGFVPWPVSLRWQVQLASALAVLGVAVGVFLGGAYMSGRFQSSDADSRGRVDHWTHALALMSGGDWLFGKGLGRFSANLQFSGRPEDQTGDYRWLHDSEGGRLLFTSGRYTMGTAQIFRMSQRIAAPSKGLELRFRARSNEPFQLQAEVCDKHLLYPGYCIDRQPGFAATNGQWQSLRIPLDGDPPHAGDPWAPKLITFSIALQSPGSRVEIDDLALSDTQGRNLLVNGDFEHGLARWYSSSDRHHEPWHMKNMAAHLVFEQGLAGLALLGALSFMALWRVTVGAARSSGIAPALAAGIVGMLVVGAVDSLLDMPRVAWLYYSLIVLALALPPREPGAESEGRAT